MSLLSLYLVFIFQSAQVEGSPWILYSAERFQEFLCFLEDGRFSFSEVKREREIIFIFPPRHPDLLTHGLPQTYKVASAKVKTEGLASPHITLYNSSCFRGIIIIIIIIITVANLDSRHDTVIYSDDVAGGGTGERNGDTEGGWRSSDEQRLR